MTVIWLHLLKLYRKREVSGSAADDCERHICAIEECEDCAGGASDVFAI